MSQLTPKTNQNQRYPRLPLWNGPLQRSAHKSKRNKEFSAKLSDVTVFFASLIRVIPYLSWEKLPALWFPVRFLSIQFQTVFFSFHSIQKFYTQVESRRHSHSNHPEIFSFSEGCTNGMQYAVPVAEYIHMSAVYLKPAVLKRQFWKFIMRLQYVVQN